jgi:hypothetical protein
MNVATPMAMANKSKYIPAALVDVIWLRIFIIFWAIIFSWEIVLNGHLQY